MIVVVLGCAPPKLRGYCSSWALQIATGVYVANLPQKTQKEIWRTIEDWADEETRAVMIWTTPDTEQGLAVETIGSPRRRITDREGLLVSTWIPLERAEQTP